MKLSALLTTLSCASTLVSAAGAPAASWLGPPGNYTSIKSKIKVIEGKHTGYYYAVEAYYQTGDVGYIGLQPRTTGPNHLTYSVFGDGPTSEDLGRCHNGADGGDGVSCAYDWPWEFNRTYTTEIRLAYHNDTDKSNNWVGLLHDDESGIDVIIGNYTTPEKYGYIQGYASSFDEWYGGPQTPVKECITFTNYIQYNPVFVNSSGEFISNLTEIDNANLTNGKAECRPNNGSDQKAYIVPGGVRFENGFRENP